MSSSPNDVTDAIQAIFHFMLVSSKHERLTLYLITIFSQNEMTLMTWKELIFRILFLLHWIFVIYLKLEFELKNRNFWCVTCHKVVEICHIHI